LAAADGELNVESITYNGVKLEVIVGRMNSVVEYSSDGTEALYTRHEIEVDAWFNPQAGSFDEDGVVSPGNFPGLTNNNIKELLSTPRQRLVVRAGGSIVIDSPKEDYPCDALNGPKPITPVKVSRMHGVRTWAVHLHIHTWVGFEGTELPNNEHNILLSNRWNVLNDIDENRLSTRLVEGVAEFRVDELEKRGANADSFRSVFAGFSTPLNFKRIGVSVNAMSDGASVHYRVIDREQYLNLGGDSIATSIEGHVYGGFQRGGIAGRITEEGLKYFKDYVGGKGNGPGLPNAFRRFLDWGAGELERRFGTW
jgi:hypothetical protein